LSNNRSSPSQKLSFMSSAVSSVGGMNIQNDYITPATS
jgi:hypothetical protein